METYDIRKFVRAHFPVPLQRMLVSGVRGLRSCIGSVRYSGKDAYCPCCNGNFSRFKDYPLVESGHDAKWNGNGQNMLCPRCMSLGRHRMICDFLEKTQVIKPNEKVLMFAPEESILKWMKTNKINIITADYLDKLVDINIDIQNIKLEDNSIDFIICNHVLEHVPDYKKALLELNRILKKSGTLILTVPIQASLKNCYEDASITSMEERATHFGQEDHFRIFGTDFKQSLEQANFAVKELGQSDFDEKIRPVPGPVLYDDYNRVFISNKVVK